MKTAWESRLDLGCFLLDLPYGGMQLKAYTINKPYWQPYWQLVIYGHIIDRGSATSLKAAKKQAVQAAKVFLRNLNRELKEVEYDA